MHTIELSDEELKLLHAALHSYLDDFGHEEADVLRSGTGGATAGGGQDLGGHRAQVSAGA